MAKRACPFEDNYAPQMKIHVGSNDIERRDESYMKNIYEKTINKLYQGVNNNNIQPSRYPVQVKELSSGPGDAVPSHRLCIECNEVKYIQGNCWFCEVSLCNVCIKTCSMCSELFCSRCCVAM